MRLDERARLTTPTKKDEEEAPVRSRASVAAQGYHFLLTAALVFLSWCGATYAPGVAVVWAFAGSSVGLFISYALPCALYLHVRRHKRSPKVYACRAILAVSVVLMAVCLARNVATSLAAPFVADDDDDDA